MGFLYLHLKKKKPKEKSRTSTALKWHLDWFTLCKEEQDSKKVDPQMFEKGTETSLIGREDFSFVNLMVSFTGEDKWQSGIGPKLQQLRDT